MRETALRPGDVYVAPSPLHGRGVFAARRFEPDEQIEAAPVLVVPYEAKDHLDWTPLWGYYFEWAEGGAGIALGYGCLYNHSWTPNARYELDFDAEIVRFFAVEVIEPDTEITINYTGTPEGRGELWFDAGPAPD